MSRHQKKQPAKRGTVATLIARIGGELARHVEAVVARLRFAEAAVVLARAADSSLRVIRADAPETAVDGARRRRRRRRAHWSRSFHVRRT
jgi:hypothetical protein